MPSYNFKALVHRERFFIAECAELGLTAQGRSVEEAIASLRITTEEYLLTLGDNIGATLQALDTRPISHEQRGKGVLTRRYRVELPEA
jgi:predicted RNase H-like HicB family nuclease